MILNKKFKSQLFLGLTASIAFSISANAAKMTKPAGAKGVAKVTTTPVKTNQFWWPD